MAKEHVVKEGARVKKSTGDRIVDVIIYAALGLIALSTVLPFLYVVAGSFATEKELTEKAFFIIPTEFSLNAQADNKTNAVVRQTGMFLYENGNAGTVQQIDLAQ